VVLFGSAQTAESGLLAVSFFFFFFFCGLIHCEIPNRREEPEGMLLLL
jgi:hypothetical protein